MKKSNILISAFLLLAVLILSRSIYVVSEMERAVLLRFGEIVEFDVAPGLHFKVPILNTVRKFDGRIIPFRASGFT